MSSSQCDRKGIIKSQLVSAHVSAARMAQNSSGTRTVLSSKSCGTFREKCQLRYYYPLSKVFSAPINLTQKFWGEIWLTHKTVQLLLLLGSLPVSLWSTKRWYLEILDFTKWVSGKRMAEILDSCVLGIFGCSRIVDAITKVFGMGVFKKRYSHKGG